MPSYRERNQIGRRLLGGVRRRALLRRRRLRIDARRELLHGEQVESRGQAREGTTQRCPTCSTRSRTQGGSWRGLVASMRSSASISGYSGVGDARPTDGLLYQISNTSWPVTPKSELAGNAVAWVSCRILT